MTEPVVCAHAVMTPQNVAYETERLIAEACMQAAGYLLIIAAELGTAILCWIGALVLLSAGCLGCQSALFLPPQNHALSFSWIHIPDSPILRVAALTTDAATHSLSADNCRQLLKLFDFLHPANHCVRTVSGFYDARERILSLTSEAIDQTSKGKSAISNGTRLFIDGLDGRSALARRYRDLVAEFVSDLGGADVISAAQRAIVRRAASFAFGAKPSRFGWRLARRSTSRPIRRLPTACAACWSTLALNAAPKT